MNRLAKTFTLEGHRVMLLQYITTDLNDLLSGLVCMELNMSLYGVKYDINAFLLEMETESKLTNLIRENRQV